MRYAILTFVAFMSACGEPATECRHTTDCQQHEFCLARTCAELNASDPIITESHPTPIQDVDLGMDAPDIIAVADLPPHPCSNADYPRNGSLVINEVYANVAPGDDGDANGDGSRDAYSDEFLEIWNTTATTQRLDGVEILVGEVLKWKFDEPYCIYPGQALVLFAQGTPGLAADIPVVVSETRLSLSNSGGSVTLRTEQETIDRFEWGPNVECAWVRSPEGVAGAMPVPHSLCGGLFSPGRCCDGTPTQDGCAVPGL